MTSIDERIRKTTLLESALRRPELGSVFGLFAVVVAFMIMTGPIVGLGEKNTFADMWVRSAGFSPGSNRCLCPASLPSLRPC